MVRPYALLRAGFPYLKTIGEFINTSWPLDIAFGKEGRLYVLVSGGSGPISILDMDDQDLGSFGAPGFGLRRPSYKCNMGNDWPVQDGALLSPAQIIVDNDEFIYVSDEATDRITIYDRHGNYAGRWGERGTGDGQMDHPMGIAFDANEDMYVVDSLNHRVQKFTKDGKYLGKWGSHGKKPGEFDTPWGIHIDELGFIYVADWRNDRIQKFDADMGYVFGFGISGDRDGELTRPAGLAVDNDGDIYICDWENNRIQLFDPQGRFVQKFTGDATLSKSTLRRMFTRNSMYHRYRESGSLELEKMFGRPRSVRVDRNGHMFVPDYECMRVQIYKKEAYHLTEEQITPPLASPVLIE